MSDSRKKRDDLVTTVRKERNQLRSQNLAGLDAKDEYERLSQKCDQLVDQYQPITEAVEKTTDEVASDLGTIADELKVGFLRVREAIRNIQQSMNLH